MNQPKNNNLAESFGEENYVDIRLEKITRSILKLIKDADASSSGGVRTDFIRKLIIDELKKDKSK